MAGERRIPFPVRVRVCLVIVSRDCVFSTSVFLLILESQELIFVCLHYVSILVLLRVFILEVPGESYFSFSTVSIRQIPFDSFSLCGRWQFPFLSPLHSFIVELLSFISLRLTICIYIIHEMTLAALFLPQQETVVHNGRR